MATASGNHTSVVAEHLSSPSNVPLAPWNDLQSRLEQGITYLLATVRPDSTPHVVPVLGLWLDNALYFNARESTRKAQHLLHNAHCVMTVAMDTFDLTVEGEAAKVSDEPTMCRVAEQFTAKYTWWHPIVLNGVFYPDGTEEPPSNIYKVTPKTAFGFDKEKGFSATRWHF